MSSAIPDRVLAVAEAIAIVEMHAGFIKDGRFQPGPNTMRIAEGVVAHLAEQGWAVTMSENPRKCVRCAGSDFLSSAWDRDDKPVWICRECLGALSGNGSSEDS